VFMKKALVLLLVVSTTQGLFSGNYDVLDKHFKDLKITKKCLENSQGTVTSQCDFLNREFQKYEDIVRLSLEKEIDQSFLGPIVKMAKMGHILDSLVSKEEIFNAVDIILSHESDETKKKEFDLLLSTPIIYTLTKKIE